VKEDDGIAKALEPLREVGIAYRADRSHYRSPKKS
jgi:hypothetical protein